MTVQSSPEVQALVPSSIGAGLVMPIGGAEEKDGNPEVLQTFISLAGREDARIAVIPAASSTPQESGEKYVRVFEELGAAEARFIRAETPEAAEKDETIDILRWATGIFMTGGDQNRLVEIYCNNKAAECIMERSRDGVIVAGTSAGAAFMASHMIAGGEGGSTPIKGMAEIRGGLGLIQNVIIDTHFGPRGRTGRLMELHAGSPEVIAIGLDEDTAAIIDHDMMMRVVGSGAVTVIDGTSIRSDLEEVADGEPIMTSGLEMHTVTPRYTFDLRARKFVPPLRPCYRQG